MAIPLFVGSGVGVVIATGSATVSGPSSGVDDICMLQVVQDGTGAGPTTAFNANLSPINGGGGGPDAIGSCNLGSPTAGFQYLKMGRVSTSGIPSFSVTTAGDDLYCRAYSFSGVSTSLSVTGIFENGGAGFTSIHSLLNATIPAETVTTQGTDRLAVTCIGVDDDNVIADFTGESGGDWVLAATFASATGTDGACAVQIADIAAQGAISGGSYTMAAADNWGTIGFAFIPAVTGGGGAVVLPDLVMGRYPRV